MSNSYLDIARAAIRRTETPEPELRLNLGRKRRNLTLRQRKFIKAKLSGRSSCQAALSAGYSRYVAQRADQKITKSAAVEAFFRDWMEQGRNHG